MRATARGLFWVWSHLGKNAIELFSARAQWLNTPKGKTQGRADWTKRPLIFLPLEHMASNRTQDELTRQCGSEQLEDLEQLRLWAAELNYERAAAASKRELCQHLASALGSPVSPVEDVPLDPDDLDPVSGDPLLDPVKATIPAFTSISFSL